jgi:CheY-like chemotaxis protein
LLADDSVTIQRVIELTFADEDVKVVAVSDGDEAIAELNKTAPDIVLADVGMPGKNGYEVAQHIKDTPKLAHIPVVLLTGAFEPIDQAKAAAAGCDGVLAKPFEPQLVIGRVKELLSKPKARAASSLKDVSREAPPPPAAWTLPVAAPPPAAPLQSGDAGEYFDRLDQAFANLTAGQPESPKGGRKVPAVADSIDWFASHSPAPSPARAVADRWDAGASSTPPEMPFGYTPPSQAGSTSPPPSPSAPVVPLVPPAPPPALPQLADAFAALLAAEQSSPAPSSAPIWPAAPVSSAPASEELIAQVTRRVLDELSDRVMRDAVADKVSAVAERLVREEIEKIKSSIK